MLRPLPRKELFVLLGRTLMLWKLPDDWDDTAAFYVEALEDVPADLVQVALKHARLSIKWFPKPCELREPILDELARRRAVLTRLRTMELMAKRQTAAAEGGFKYRASAEEKAAVERMLERARLRRLPIPEDEDIEPFVDLKTAHEKLAQVRPIRRNPAQASATPVNPTAETADAPADENH